jgi:lipid-A-disaccharide synthase
VPGAAVNGAPGAWAGLTPPSDPVGLTRRLARRVFITVAEASADLHASHFARALKAVDPGCTLDAFGGERLRDAGAQVHRETVSRAAMGLRALARAGEVHGMVKWLRARYAQARPDLHVCCDSWAMNVHFAKVAKEHGVPVLYYIAPQTWGSREGRVRRMRELVDHVACIWPFEEPYFRRHGIHATYVGHPLFDELPAERPPKPFLLAGQPPVVGLLAGSRKGIARKNFPRQLEVARRIRQAVPGTRFLVPTTVGAHDAVTEMARGFDGVEIAINAFDRMVRTCDLCVSVSGTATLHAAAWGVPQIVVYQGNPAAWHLIGRWLVKTRTFSMVNYLSGRPEHIVPEVIPWYGAVGPVADMAISYLRDPAKLESQRADVMKVIHAIDRPGASENAARLALSLMGTSTPAPDPT